MRTSKEIWKNIGKWRCPKCGSTRLFKDGFIHGKQRFKCKKCGGATIIPRGR